MDPVIVSVTVVISFDLLAVCSSTVLDLLNPVIVIPVLPFITTDPFMAYVNIFPEELLNVKDTVPDVSSALVYVPVIDEGAAPYVIVLVPVTLSILPVAVSVLVTVTTNVNATAPYVPENDGVIIEEVPPDSTDVNAKVELT